MKITKVIYIVLGLVFTGLAGLGAVIPLLPTFPFLMLAIFFFARSSEKMHNWLINTKLYKNNFKSYVDNRTMSKKVKIRILSTFTLVIAFAMFMMRNLSYAPYILIVVWLCHVIYFVWGVKTDNNS